MEKNLITWHQFHKDCETLAEKINKKLVWKPVGIIAVTRGGMVPATIVAQILNVKNIRTICCHSYDGQSREEINLINTPDIKEANGKGWLIIDDLVDSGETFKFIKEILPEARMASVYAKSKGLPHTEIYAEEIDDRWIVFPWERSEDGKEY